MGNVKMVEGNVFDSTADIIIHQCNNEGVMGSGVALEVRRRYPHVFLSYRNDYVNGKLVLGYVNFTKAKDNQVIGNMVAQDFDASTGCCTKYDALQKCLDEVASYMRAYNLKTVALPYLMSCFRGGGNWEIVSKMIADTLKDFDIEIWRFNNN